MNGSGRAFAGGIRIERVGQPMRGQQESIIVEVSVATKEMS